MELTAEIVTIAGSIAGGIAAGATSYLAVRWEQRDMRRRLHHGERIFTWLAEHFMILAQAHNENHPGGRKIDVSGLARLLFEARNSEGGSIEGA
jgi:hypothetical protein